MDAERVDHWHYLAGRKQADQTFNGALDDVVAFCRPLSPTDIQLLYRGPGTDLQTALASTTSSVDAGPNQQHALPAISAKLHGTASGAIDGTTFAWSLVHGDGYATFADPTKLYT